MNIDEVIRQFETLPPDAQKEVLTFISFLHFRYKSSEGQKDKPQKGLEEESFVGMWHDNEELTDSVAWVRKKRLQEW